LAFSWPRFLALLGGCVVLLAPVLRAQHASERAAPVLEDPLPLRRVLVPPARVQAELQKARGVLQQLPYGEFQARVQAAARAAQALQEVPRLTEASYSASLKDRGLVGNGEWTVFNPRPGGILPLPDLNLALRKAQFKSSATDAILGDLDGRNLGLLIRERGKHAVIFDWSARGGAGPEGLHFKLRVPAAPVATLDLTLPSDRLVRLLSQRSGSLTQLYKDRSHTRWQILFAGRSEVDLVIHRTTGLQPLVRARLQTREELTPNRLWADFRFQIQTLHNLARKLYLECDPGLTPYDIRIRGASLRGKFHPAASPRAPALLVIQLTEPFLDPLRPLPPFTVRCFAPLAPDRPWACPGLRLVKVLPWGNSSADEPAKGESLADPRLIPAFAQSETLRLQVHPTLQLEQWQAGSFRLTGTDNGADLSQVLTLVGNSDPASGDRPARPRAVVKMQEAACLVRQSTWWQIHPDGARLDARLTYELARGRLFQLRLGLPPGWDVEQVQLGGNGRDPLKNWGVTEEKPRPVVVIDLQRPLLPQMPLTLSVRLRQAWRSGVPLGSLDFPDLEPLEAQFRSGALAITVDPYLQVQASRPAATLAVVGDGGRDEAPWGKRLPDLYYPFRSRMAGAKVDASPPRPALTGKLLLRPRPDRFQARCVTEVILAREQASAQMRLHLTAGRGHPRTFYLHVTSSMAGPWHWRTEQGSNRVESLVPLLPELLSVGSLRPFQAMPLLARPLPGQWWQLTLARPLQDSLTLVTSVPLQGPLAGQAREVPLLSVPAADPLEGEVTLYLAGGDLVDVKPQGLREVPSVAKNGADGLHEAALPWRRFRYQEALAADPGGRPPLSLRLSWRNATGRLATEVIDQACWTTYVEPSGRLLHHFTFQAWNWRRRTLTVRLPGAGEVLAVRAYAKWITPPVRTASPGGALVALPVASDHSRHPYEIVYATQRAGASWRLWSQVDEAAPVLPVRALAWQRLWRLPPEVAPLHPADYCRLPGVAMPRAFPSFASLLDLAVRLHPAPSSRLRDQKRLMAGAAADSESLSGDLGESLGRLVFHHLKAQTALVLDVQALVDAGLTPRTPLPARVGSRAQPWWERYGLVYVPCPEAALLTTFARRNSWPAGAVPDPVVRAVAQAAAFDWDASGLFRTATDWLRHPPSTAPERLPALLLPDQVGRESYEDWTTWEPVAGGVPEEILWVVRPEAVSIAGFALALLLWLVAWCLRPLLSRCWRFRLLLAWLAGFGLALLWLPASLHDIAWWPVLAGAALLILWYLWSAAARQVRVFQAAPARPAPAGTAGAAAAAFLALACLAALPGQAAAPVPTTVLILPGPPEAPERLSALVPPELLERLDELAGRRAERLRGAILLSARYHKGKVTGTIADFEADFQVYCFSKEATLVIPLDNVILKPRGMPPLDRPAFFAGKAALPVALPPPQKGYSLRLQVDKPGVYPLELRFSARVTEAGPERSLRFTIPRLAQSRLVLNLPGGAKDPEDETGLGVQHLSNQDAQPHLEAELGRVADLHLRWRQPGPREPATAVGVKDTYLWDLRQPDPTLSGILHYGVKNGAVSQLTLALPEGLEVRSIEVRRGAASDGVADSRLLNRRWRLVGRGSARQLLVPLHRPVTGNMQMILELLPRLPTGTNNLVLDLPTPLGVDLSPGSLAYRVEGVRAIPSVQHLSVAGMDQDTFIQDWRKDVPKTRDPGSPTLAYTFKRTPGGTPALRLVLQPPEYDARQDISWRIGPEYADLQRASVTLTSVGGRLMLAEWDAPGLTVAEVSGPEVRSWTQSGALVQVWLTKPCARTTVELSGWRELTPAGPGSRRFDLSGLRLIGVRFQATRLHLDAAAGLSVEPRSLVNLAPRTGAGSSRAANSGLTYTTQQSVYGGTFEVRPFEATVRIGTWAEVRDRQLVFTSTLDYQVTRGELRTLRVRLRNWKGEDVRLEATFLASRSEQRPRSSERIWTLILRPGVSRRYSIRLTGRVPLHPATAALMPEVRDLSTQGGLGNILLVDRRVGVAGEELTVEETRGLAPLAHASIRGRPERSWIVQTDRWQLRLRPRSAPGSATARIFLAEQAAAVVDGRRWVHQAAYRIYVETPADLVLRLPEGASFLTASVDGIGITPRLDGFDRLWLSRQSGPALHNVRVSWVYRESCSPLSGPNLARPQLVVDGAIVTNPPTLWLIRVPSGYQVEALVGGDMVEPSVGSAAQDIHRALAEFRLSRWLGDRVRGGTVSPFTTLLREAQERFAWYCQQAEHRLALAARQAPRPGADPRRLQARLAQLRLDNTRLLRAPAVNKIRVEAEAWAQVQRGSPEPGMAPLPVPRPGEEPFLLNLPEPGLPTFLTADSLRGTPHLFLATRQARQTLRAAYYSGWLLGGLLVGWCLSFFPVVLTWLQRTWPEQIFLLGWTVGPVLGYPWMGLALMALGGASRLFLLVHWGLGLFQRVRPAPISGGPGPTVAS
jgi:hypothetical protein